MQFSAKGLGVVIRDGYGDLLLAASKGLHEMFSPKSTELFAPILGKHIASHMGHRFVLLEIDAKEVISSLFEGVLGDEARSLFNFF